MSGKTPRSSDEPRSSAQADLGGGMYTFYREGRFDTSSKFEGKSKPERTSAISRQSNITAKTVPVGPIRGESEADVTPPVYFEQNEPITTSEAELGKVGIEGFAEALKNSRPPQPDRK